MISKDQASQAADELMKQQNNLRIKDRVAKSYLSSRYFRCPELNRLSLEDRHAVLQTARRTVLNDRVVNFWFVMLLLAPIIFAVPVVYERLSYMSFYALAIWILTLWNFRQAMVKRVAKCLARDMMPENLK